MSKVHNYYSILIAFNFYPENWTVLSTGAKFLTFHPQKVKYATIDYKQVESENDENF